MSDLKARLAAHTQDSRAALREAIRERNAAREQVHRAQSAERRGRELLKNAEDKVASFGDVDAAVLNHRAEKIKRAATGGPTADMNLPDNLIKLRADRDEAREYAAATKVAHEGLVAELKRAQDNLRRMQDHVSAAAAAILVQEGAAVAGSLRAAWEAVWLNYDALNALAGCWLPYAEDSRPTRLPADALTALQSIAVLDHRQHPGGSNTAFIQARQCWIGWHAALCKDADANASSFAAVNVFPTPSKARPGSISPGISSSLSLGRAQSERGAENNADSLRERF